MPPPTSPLTPRVSPPTPALHLKPRSPSPFLCPQPSPTCQEEFEVEAGGPGSGRGNEHWTSSHGELGWSLTVWPEWLPSLDGFLPPRAEPGQHKASESSRPPCTGRGRICLTLTRTEGWRDPHPRVPQGCTAPPLRQAGPLSVCLLLLCLSVACSLCPSLLALLFFLAVSFLTPFLTPLSPAPSPSNPPNSLCKAARVLAHPTPSYRSLPYSRSKPQARGLPGDPVNN